MSVVYISSKRGKLSKKGEILEYSDYLGNCAKIIPEKTEAIISFGILSVSGEALHLCLKSKIPLYFVYHNGKYKAGFVFEEGKNTLLRHKQHVLAENKEFVAKVAQSIVKGKVLNQYLFAKRIARKNNKESGTDNENAEDSTENSSEKDVLQTRVYELRRLLDILEKRQHTIEEIRGYEGASAKAYFACLGYNIHCDWTSFKGRNKRPPRDPVNAALSFMYTLLASKVDLYAFLAGLDLSVGALHDFSYGRQSLVCDLMEEYRTPLVDTAVCSLFNKGVLKQEDFLLFQDGDESEEVDLVENEKVVYLNDSGRRKVIEAFETKLEQKHYYPGLEKVLSYNEIIQKQIGHYKSLLRGECDEYTPILIK